MKDEKFVPVNDVNDMESFEQVPAGIEWTCKIWIAQPLIDDGFELTADRLHQILMRGLSHAYGFEIQCEVGEARPEYLDDPVDCDPEECPE